MPRVWQRMLSGRRLDLLDPSPLDVEIQDIIHGLARVARWNGQTNGPYAFSVAQHSLVVEQIFTIISNPTPDEQLIALLHDGPEYVVGDMISPFKAVIGDNYKSIEKRLEAAIHLRYGLTPDISPELKKKIKKADQISAYFEAVLLAGFSDKEARSFFGQPKNITKDQLLIEPLPIDDVETLFKARFEKIDSERNVINNKASTQKESR
ncbi:YfbR-like 5'-deoxynucleotidase [Lentilitoribacter sp. EG35]|uniref:YfbR-like 5'-deoxynucleotidase n=1 Tax=Lentilitoribacter sp. EG35 TaxID=3234192 RepID=UPI00345F2F65